MLGKPKNLNLEPSLIPNCQYCTKIVFRHYNVTRCSALSARDRGNLNFPQCVDLLLFSSLKNCKSHVLKWKYFSRQITYVDRRRCGWNLWHVEESSAEKMSKMKMTKQRSRLFLNNSLSRVMRFDFDFHHLEERADDIFEPFDFLFSLSNFFVRLRNWCVAGLSFLCFEFWQQKFWKQRAHEVELL